MDGPIVTSQFSGRQRLHARIVLTLFALTSVLFVAVTGSSLKSGFADAPYRGPSDVDLYRAEIERMHAGQSYYDAAGAELSLRGYPTRSLFNWRTPLPVWLIGTVPHMSLAKVLLGILSLALVCLSFQLVVKEGGLRQGLLAALLLVGALLPCGLGDLMLMSELWSGVLIALSAVCFGLNRSTWGIAAALAALFFRELAAPYCVVALGLTLWERRWREVGLWTAGLAAYGLFLAWHAGQVLPRMSPDGILQAHGWIRFGGAGFLISTAQMNTYLLLLPQWVTAVYLACALLGCASWNTSAGRLIGLSVAAYAVAFGLAGNDYNQYWGSMIAPLLCLAASRCPAALSQLWLAAGLPRSIPRPALVSIGH